MKIELGGKERTLKIDLNAIAEIGERLNLKIRLAHIDEDLLEAELPLSAMRTLIWAALKHEDAELTEEMVGSWITPENIGEVFQGFLALFSATSQEMPVLTELIRNTQMETSGEANEPEVPTKTLAS